jgi:predicted transcriptional regulator/transcriptional regulator with XRE-family HTH domain
MPGTALTGSRVRERRLTLGLKQATVAAAAGLSPSYLNLIEHNRRRIGPAVLARLAAALSVAPEILEGGAGAALAEELRAAAAAEEGTEAEVSAVEEFIGRFPGWAGLTAALARRSGQLSRAVEALNDRLGHDPHLSASLHEVLSAAASVRSIAGILAETEDIEAEWSDRFHRSLAEDSERLAIGAEALVAYLDGSDDGREDAIASPQEEVELWLAARDWQASEEGLDQLASAAARALARDLAIRAARDAAVLPEPAFRAALAEGADPASLAARFGAPIPDVLRRIALLPGSRAGLVLCDASGTLTFRKPAEGFAVPRFGAACPLWPLYTALGSPLRPVEARLQVAGQRGRRFRLRAFCQPSWPGGFGGPELREAAMLIEHDLSPATGPLPEVGSTCRICPASACPARRESSILTLASSLTAPSL